jgi:hypothetical protein
LASAATAAPLEKDEYAMIKPFTRTAVLASRARLAIRAGFASPDTDRTTV